MIDWLLDGDPAIRWQVLRDLTDASPDEVAAERARVEHEGWGARLLALEDPDGLWDGGACFPAAYTGGEPGQPWTATMHTLQTLQLLGLDPASESARRAIALVAENGRWEHDGQRYFDGEVEPCINGRTIETGAYFGVDVAPIVERILGERLADGGWNCEAENGSVRSSFDTTINVLDGLLEFERATGGSDEVRDGPPRRRGVPARARPVPPQEHRRGRRRRRTSSSRSRTTGTTTCCARSTTSAASGADPDPRMAEAVEVVRSQAAARRPVAARPHPSGSRPLRPRGRRRARRAAGTPSARSGCSSGGTEPPDGRTAEGERCARALRPVEVTPRLNACRRERDEHPCRKPAEACEWWHARAMLRVIRSGTCWLAHRRCVPAEDRPERSNDGSPCHAVEPPPAQPGRHYRLGLRPGQALLRLCSI